MHWFSGSIVEAVNLSKSKNAIFVVYVEGEDDNSQDFNKVLADQRVLSRLESERFVAIRIKSGSQDYVQFAQIYQIVPVPSLFFIGRNGTPLEVIGSGLDSEKLIAKIDLLPTSIAAGVLLNAAPSMSVQPSTSSQSPSASSQNLIASETSRSQQPTSTNVEDAAKAVEDDTPEGQNTASSDGVSSPPKRQKSEEHEVVCDGDVCIRKPKNKEADTPTTSPEKPPPAEKADNPPAALPIAAEPSAPVVPPVEDRVRKAQELLEQKRREKEDREKEEAKLKETERRQTGKGIAELKRWQEEQEMKNLQEERRREKQENERARAKILEQIAQDRAERRSKDPMASPTSPTCSKPPAPVETPSASTAGSEVRIQFKLADGSSKAAKFTAETTLQELRDYVTTELKISPPFALWTMFPRRAFTEEESSSDLGSLGLVPSAVLLVVGEGSVGNARPSSGAPVRIIDTFTGIYNMVLQLLWSLVIGPAQFAWSWVTGGATARRHGEKRSADGQPSRSTPGTSHRRPGDNVRRLRGSTPPPDDNNTWNGNSTQQM